MTKTYHNILIIQTAFIGDAILASSLVEKLHSTFPKANLSILVRKGNESIYDAHPFIQEVLVWNKQHHKTRNLLLLLKSIRSRHFDAVINCHRFASSGFLAGFSGAKHIAGFQQNPFSFLFNLRIKHSISNGLHETERYNQLIKDFTNDTVFKPKLYPSESDYQSIAAFKQQAYVCIAPASVWFTKQVPTEKWIALCNSLNTSETIYLLGATNDNDLCEKIKSASQHPKIRILAGKLSLLQSCALMKHSKMNYVNDSAPLHLASSVNAPVTAFFLSTVPEFGFGPLSDDSSIQQVLNLPCRPCGLHGFKACPETHFKCGNLLPLG